MTLESRLTAIAGVGPARAAQLERLGLLTVRDVIWWLPRHYLDCRYPSHVNELLPDQLAVIRARASDVRTSRSRRGQAVIRATLADSSGEIEAVWFGQPFWAETLRRPGEKLLVGKVGRDRRTYQPILASPTLIKTTGLIPIYSVTQGLTSGALAKIIQAARASLSAKELVEPWPKEVLKEADLPDRRTALRWAHAPDRPEQAAAARRRFAFDHLVAMQRGLWAERRAADGLVGPAIAADVGLLKQFREALPFELTAGQVKAIWKIAQDLASGRVSRRLLNGDVGSGKTAVAAAALLLAVKAGWQGVLLAPTDLLVQQHRATLARILASFKISVGVVTARQKEWESDILVGTHALFAKGASYKKVGLVVVDEQHRFGVEQRDKLWRLTGEANRRPHLLSLSATPIPRTLALTLYGGLEVTQLREKPPGRPPIETRIINEDEVVKLVRAAVGRGEQAYVVCPLIEEVELSGSIFDERRTVKTVADELAAALPDAKIGILHGRLSSFEKDDAIGQFVAGQLDGLVATTVVEVGVDVPGATLMIIENAERFGIAQLHQLRGRVGRSERPATCALLVRGGGEPALARCRKVVSTEDGFALAEFDLQERGPGELVGLTQSGFSRDFLDEIDLELIEHAQALARDLP